MKHISFKHPDQKGHISLMHPLIIMVMFDMAWWCLQRNIKCVVTDAISTFKKDKKLGRKSNSHRTKRAFDLRSWTFLPAQRQEFIKHFNDKYYDIASVSSSDNIPRLVVLHGEGDNEHFHIAIHSRFSINY